MHPLESGGIMDRTSRYSDIVSNMNDYFYHILGCGAIGSSAATQLCRMGAEDFVLYDMDKVETANIGVSQFNSNHISMYKTEALTELLKAINEDIDIVQAKGYFDTFLYADNNDIIILGFDNMKSRLEAVKSCLSNKHFKPRLLIDGRMGAEHYQQYS